MQTECTRSVVTLVYHKLLDICHVVVLIYFGKTTQKSDIHIKNSLFVSIFEKNNLCSQQYDINDFTQRIHYKLK